MAGGAPDAANEPRELRGAAAWAKQFLAFSRRAGSGSEQLVLIDGAPGVIVAPRGKLSRAVTFEVAGGKVVRIEVIGDAARLRELELAVL
jgi:RNA polymerase sigma-70 factor (ECF subfamily)